jgi:acyl-CoA thioesterase-2
MPDVPGPDELPSEKELAESRKDSMPVHMREMMNRERPIEMKRVEPHDYMNPVKSPPIANVWIRARESLSDDMAMHQCLLAYASDMGILGTCLLPHGKSFMTGMMTASLDHAMWFHNDFRFDEWILFSQDSPAAAGSRGFNRGTMYSQDGKIIASVAQEGLIRDISKG